MKDLNRNISSFRENRLVFQEAEPYSWNPKTWGGSDKPGEKSWSDKLFEAPEWVGKLGEGLGEFFKAFGTLLGTANRAFGHAANFLDWSVTSAKDLVELCKDKFHGTPKELPIYSWYRNSMLRSYKTTVDGVTPVSPPQVEATVEKKKEFPRASMVLAYDVRLACIQYKLHQLKVYYAPVIQTVKRLQEIKEQMKTSRSSLGTEIALEQKQSRRDPDDKVLSRRRLPQDKKLKELETFSEDRTAPLPMPKSGTMMSPDGTEDKECFFAGPGKAKVKISAYLKKITPILNKYQRDVSELDEEIYKLGYYKGKILMEINADRGDSGKKDAAEAEMQLIESNRLIIEKRLGTNNYLYTKDFKKRAGEAKPTPLFDLFNR